MAINFPTSIDDFTDYVDGVTVMEASTLNNMQKAIEALEVKVGVDESVDTDSHDYKIDNISFWTSVLVFDDDSPSSFEDLDLSSYVGANRALCFLKIVNDSTEETQTFKIKENGETEELSAGGCSVSYNQLEETYSVLTVETDGAGIIEWIGEGYATKIYLLSYLK